MRKILNLAVSDYKRRWNKPALILLYVFTPVIISLIMWFAFGGGSETGGFAPLKLAIVNNDKDGFISDFFSKAFTGEETREFINASVVSEEKALKMINGRKVSAVIIIPEGFSENIIKGEKSELRLIKNPTEIVYPMIAETGLNIIKDGTNYFLTIFGDEIDLIRKLIKNRESMDSKKFQEIYNSVESKIKKIIPLFGDRGIDIIEIKKEKKRIPWAIFFFAGMSFFFLFFISNAILMDMVKERNSFMIKRLFLSELKKCEYYFARLFSAIVFLFTIEIVLAIAGRIIFSLKTSHYFLLLANLFLSALILTFLSAAIMGLSNNEKQVHNLGMVVVFIFAILGGSLIPVSVLPEAIGKISIISPLFYITESTISLVLGNMERFYKMFEVSSLISLVLFVIAYILNIRALKKVVR